MKEGLWVYIIIIIAFIGSIFVVSFALGRHHKRNAEIGISKSKKKYFFKYYNAGQKVESAHIHLFIFMFNYYNNYPVSVYTANKSNGA